MTDLQCKSSSDERISRFSHDDCVILDVPLNVIFNLTLKSHEVGVNMSGITCFHGKIEVSISLWTCEMLKKSIMTHINLFSIALSLDSGLRAQAEGALSLNDKVGLELGFGKGKCTNE